MLPGFEALVEERIKKAQKEGAFDNLDGADKPLKFEESSLPSEYRMAHKILKNAGFLPPEVELRKQVFNEQQLLESVSPGSPEHARIQKKLNYLLTKLGTVRQGRTCSPALTDAYRDNLIKKIS